MTKLLFDTKTLNLSEILGNSKIYNVPKFQRSYSWTEENWEDLWDDIISLKENIESFHYLGTIVLQTKDNKTFTIIDGQQRIVTLSILILGCIKLLDNFIIQNCDSEKNKERKDIFLNQFIGFKDPKSLTYQSKLSLNDTDKDIYNSYLVQFSKPLNSSRLPDSNKLLINAFDYFSKKLNELNFKNGEEIVEFIDIISNRLIFIQIIVDDYFSAYTVFETLNARGLELTTTDLLKNFIFSLLESENDIINIQPRWDKIVNTVNYSKFPTFLRYYLNSKQELVRSERLFKEIKNKVNHKNDVINLLGDLDNYSDVYVAFDDPENELWKEFNNYNDIKKLLAELKLFDVEQYKSLLLSVFFNMKSHFENALRIIKTITFRYNIIGKLNPSELERAYNKTAIKIHKGEIQNAQKLQKELMSVYIDDENFKNIFSTKTFDTRKVKNKKIVKYILLSIENQKFNQNYYLFESDFTIEHIYPENYMGDEKTSIDENAIYRLGNMTLIEAKLNRECANKKFNEKKDYYNKSNFNLTKELTEKDIDEWGIDEVKERQRELANYAVSIWKLPFS